MRSLILDKHLKSAKVITPLFSESQRFKQWWIWLIIGAINGFFIALCFIQIILRHPVGNHPMPDAALLCTPLFALLLFFILYVFRLETQIREEGIYVRFFPIQIKFQHYSWSNIQQAYLRQYNAMREYGGWGFRTIGKDSALNISGNQGIQLVINDGSRMLIGTRKPEEAAKVLKQMGKYAKSD